MSQYYQKLPSEILHVKNEYVAYCLDESIHYASLVGIPQEEESDDDTVDLADIMSQGKMRGVELVIED